jgi:hypothetical protein
MNLSIVTYLSMEYLLLLLHGCYPKGGVSFSKDSFVVNESLVFQIKFCGEIPALRVAAKRYSSCLV